MTLTLTRILGWLVIAHGLSHAVLPMRGFAAPLPTDNWMPVALYGVSMVGFVAAGLGLLGVRPFERAISPVLVVASGWSLVGILTFEDPSLWFGAASDVALLLIGLWRAFAGWPEHPSHQRIWHVAAVTLSFILVSYVGLAAFSYPWHRSWGSTPEELKMSLPGDVEPRDIALEAQHAITIEAPVEEVWTALIEVGQARGLIGEDPATTASAMTPEKLLVLENRGAFVLQPISDERTRLIVRSRMGDPDTPVWSSAAHLLGVQPSEFIIRRRMMRTIKTLAEERYAVRAAEDPARTIDIVGTDDMKYSINEIVAAPGERLRIRLTAKGVIPKVAMAHNVVVVKIDTDVELLLKDGAPYRENDFIPPAMMSYVIAKTSLAGAGERVQVTFNAPETPGEYPFFCTFAGHYQAGMKGTLIVKADTRRFTEEAP